MRPVVRSVSPLPIRRALVSALTVLAAFGALALASRAHALTAPPGGWGIAYERAAIEYWGETATRCASTSVEFDSAFPEQHRLDQREGRVLGRATIAAGPGSHCQMWIAPLPGQGIYFRCVLFAHEYGHWIGHADNPTDPRDSVRAELLSEETRDAPCRRLVEATR
jgi:hypothetical protein